MSTSPIQLPQQPCETGLVQFAPGDCDHGVVESVHITRSRNLDGVIQAQKRERCGDGSAFVSINESLCLSDVKSIAGRHIENVTIGVQRGIDSTRYGRLNCPRITDADAAAECIQRLGVEFFHFGEFQKPKEHLPSLSEAPEQVLVILKHIGLRLCKVCSLTWGTIFNSLQLRNELNDLATLIGGHLSNLLFNFSDGHKAKLAQVVSISNPHFIP